MKILIWLTFITLVLYIMIDYYEARPEPTTLIWGIRHLKQYENSECYKELKNDPDLILMYSFMLETDSTQIYHMYRRKNKQDGTTTN